MSKQSYIKHFSLAEAHSLVLFYLLMGPNKLLPLGVKVDLGAIAIKWYSAFPKAPTLLKPHDQMFLCHI